jgi:hypothetical protein
MELMLPAGRCNFAGVGEAFKDGEVLVVKRWQVSHLGSVLTRTSKTIRRSEFSGIFL